MNILQRNHVRIFGDGTQVMMFAHGFGCDQTMWRYLTPYFERDFRIVLFDYVGYGQSDQKSFDPERYSDLDGFAQDVLEICAALELTDVLFVGHSVSSMIGLLAAKQAPGLFRSLIMLGPSACYINEPGYHGGFNRDELEAVLESIGYGPDWAVTMGTLIMGNPARPDLTEELVAKFCKMPAELAPHLAKVAFFFDCRDRLPGTEVPSLLVHSTEDRVVPVSAAEYVRRYLQKSTLVEIDAQGHFPQMTAPEATANAMWDYLYTSWSKQPEGGS